MRRRVRVGSGSGVVEPVRVLLSLRPPSGVTRFVDQLVSGLGPEVEVRYFSYPAALRAEYDVFHVHWPEYLWRAPQRIARMRRIVQFLLFAVRLRVRRTVVIRTVHNLAPHKPGPRYERLLLRLVDLLTTRYILLNAATTPPTDRPTTMILHGHYVHRYGSTARTPVPGRVLFFGRIQAYKGVEGLIDVVAGAPSADLTLHVVGESRDPATTAAITAAAARDPRVTLRLEFVPDDALDGELAEAELVVLPYREMLNSGVALVAVSAHIPILTAASDGSRELRREVGEDWVLLYDGELDAELLVRTLGMVRSRETPPPPRLDGRDWAEVGRAHTALYVEAVQS